MYYTLQSLIITALTCTTLPMCLCFPFRDNGDKDFHFRSNSVSSITSVHSRLIHFPCNKACIYALCTTSLMCTSLSMCMSLILWGNRCLSIHHHSYSITVSACICNNSTTGANSSQPKPRLIQSLRYESA